VKPLVHLVVDYVREEERLLRRSLGDWAEVRLVNLRESPLRIGGAGADAAVIRPVSMYRAAYAAGAYEASGVFTVNGSEAIIYSGDKALTYARLAAANIASPATLLAAGEEAALRAAAEAGYPVVVKPPVGSWGRLVSRARDAEKLAQIARLRSALPCAPQRVMLIQPLLDTNGSDVRCIVIGGRLLGCMKRRASRPGEWRSNVALGARVEPHRPSPEEEDAAIRAARAVNGYFVSIDLFETREGPLVNEVNGVPEFKGFIRATGVNPAEELSKALREQLRR